MLFGLPLHVLAPCMNVFPATIARSHSMPLSPTLSLYPTFYFADSQHPCSLLLGVQAATDPTVIAQNVRREASARDARVIKDGARQGFRAHFRDFVPGQLGGVFWPASTDRRKGVLCDPALTQRIIFLSNVPHGGATFNNHYVVTVYRTSPPTVTHLDPAPCKDVAIRLERARGRIAAMQPGVQALWEAHGPPAGAACPNFVVTDPPADLLQQGRDLHCGVVSALYCLFLCLCDDLPRAGSFWGADVVDPAVPTDIQAFRRWVAAAVLQRALPCKF